MCLFLQLGAPVLAAAFVGWFGGGLIPIRGEVRSGVWWLVVGLPTLAVLAVSTAIVLVSWGIATQDGAIGRIVKAYERVGIAATVAVSSIFETVIGGLLGWIPVIGPLVTGVR